MRDGERASAELPADERPAPKMTAEWMAVIDAVQALDHVGEGPIGYWGVSMGARFGVPLIAEDDSVNAAVLGLFGLSEPDGPTDWGDDVRRIDVPLIFVYQREDSLMSLQSSIDLYDAFGSTEKAMHINQGGHVAVPVSEREKWRPFFVRHLGKALIQQ